MGQDVPGYPGYGCQPAPLLVNALQLVSIGSKPLLLCRIVQITAD